MKREIKFRAWCLIQEEMMPVTSIDFRADLIQVDEGDNTITDDAEMFKLMQKTPFVDKNKKAIYEGDVVDMFGQKGLRGVMTYKDGYFGMMRNNDLKNVSCYEPNFYEYDSVVMGNIYENPELLNSSY